MKKHLKLCVISSIFFALLVYLIWGNTALTVSNIKISSSRIPIAFSGFRIAQVSDLHNAEFGKGNRKFLALGKGAAGFFLGACRQGVCFVPVILLLPMVWGMNGILYAQPIADVISVVITPPPGKYNIAWGFWVIIFS